MRGKLIRTVVPCTPLDTEKVKEWGGLFGDTPEVRQKMCEACEHFGGYLYSKNRKQMPIPYAGFRCYAYEDEYTWVEETEKPEVCEFWEESEYED
jgi:hypothetical protein